MKNTPPDHENIVQFLVDCSLQTINRIRIVYDVTIIFTKNVSRCDKVVSLFPRVVPLPILDHVRSCDKGLPKGWIIDKNWRKTILDNRLWWVLLLHLLIVILYTLRQSQQQIQIRGNTQCDKDRTGWDQKCESMRINLDDLNLILSCNTLKSKKIL